jgi:hypothetical protein
LYCPLSRTHSSPFSQREITNLHFNLDLVIQAKMTEFKALTSDVRNTSLQTIASGGFVDTTTSFGSGGFPPVFETNVQDPSTYYEYNCITVDPTDASNVTEHVRIFNY